MELRRVTARPWVGLVLLGGLTLWGSWLRLADLGRQSLWLDEAVVVAQARGILQFGVPRKDNGITDWNAPVTTYLTAAGLWVIQDPHVGARLPAAVFGSLAIPLAFLVLRRLAATPAAPLIGAALIAFSTPQVAWSRQADGYMYLQFFLLACAWCLLHQTTRRRGVWLAGAYLAAVLCAGSHAGGYLAVLLVWFHLLWVFFRRAGARTAVPWPELGFMLGLLGLLYFLPAGHSRIQNVLALLLHPQAAGYGWPYAVAGWHLFSPVGLACAGAGLVVGLRRNPPVVGAMACAGAVYLLAISELVWLFAERYLFPLSGIVVPCVALGLDFLARAAANRLPPSWRGLAFGGLLVLACAAIAATTGATLLPQAAYWLGNTAPQPDWRRAYDLVAARHRASRDAGAALTVISPYPVLQDIYLGSPPESKFYIPISFSGLPGDVARHPPHTRATPVAHLESMPARAGYLLMDQMALAGIAEGRLAACLRSNAPDAIVNGKYPIFIWLTPTLRLRTP